MGKFTGCLLACDIDGTLMESGYINEKNIKAIEHFMNEGGYFAIATGRSVTAISDVTNTLLRISPSVVANGCMIYDYENEKILHQELLPKSDYCFAKEVLDSGLNVGIEVHTGKRIFTLNKTAKTDLHQKYQSLETTVISYEEVVSYDWNKVLFTCDEEKDFEKLKQLSKKYDKTSHIILTGLYLDGEHQKFLEQIPLGVSKATAIRRLGEMFNIKKGCSYAIGDFYNDIEMLENADVSATVAGAPDEIKQMVDFVSCECRDGAVSDFIDYLKD